jgi:PhzF family phenazine biosynthesis protein
MEAEIFHVDAFATRVFAGNPAAVMRLASFPDDALLQSVARENNLPVTAFLVAEKTDWQLRWFSTAGELPLCGHGTIASAWVVSNRFDPGRCEMVFHTNAGPLGVRRAGERYAMDFPSRRPKPIAPLQSVAAAIGEAPVELQYDGVNYLAVLDSAASVRRLKPDIAAIERLEGTRGLIVTAAGDQGYDCVSRYFTPQQGIYEDAVTGSAHCALTPFWCARLGKQEIRAFQASARGGEMLCRINGDRVELEGACAFYLEGTCRLSSSDTVDFHARAAR